MVRQKKCTVMTLGDSYNDIMVVAEEAKEGRSQLFFPWMTVKNTTVNITSKKISQFKIQFYLYGKTMMWSYTDFMMLKQLILESCQVFYRNCNTSLLLPDYTLSRVGSLSLSPLTLESSKTRLTSKYNLLKITPVCTRTSLSAGKSVDVPVGNMLWGDRDFMIL